MREDIAQMWIEALRSGRFRQNRLSLRGIGDSKGTHCCLGVLCELYLEAGNQGRYERGGYVIGGVYESCILPNGVATWAGMKNPIGERPFGPSLLFLNDNGASFSQIAEVIEADWEDL